LEIARLRYQSPLSDKQKYRRKFSGLTSFNVLPESRYFTQYNTHTGDPLPKNHHPMPLFDLFLFAPRRLRPQATTFISNGLLIK